MLSNIQSVYIPEQGTLADLYIHRFERTTRLYTYNPYRQESYRQRLAEVLNRDETLDRATLCKALRAYNERVNPHPAVQSHIDMLEKADSAVVIGGQQAGVLTGPLYTIHKAVTILQLARQQSEKLRKPIIPVFWIAGEDHDYEEVNHIWVPMGAHPPKKLQFRGEVRSKRSVGQRKLDMGEVEIYLKRVVDYHPDSPYKRMWSEKIYALAEQSHTFSDWFARIFHWIFADEGLVLFDSAAREFKAIAAPFYTRVIEDNEPLNEAVRARRKQVKQMGYEPQVELQEAQANIFIEENGERALLFKHGEQFVTKGNRSSYSRQALIDIAESEPERLSTNVVTRPLLQEYLFPTLASVLGRAEIAYWGLYGKAFTRFGWKMPVLFPRLAFTLIDRDVRGTMDKYNFSVRDAMLSLDTIQEQWLEEQDDIGVEAIFDSLAGEIRDLHETKTKPVLSIHKGTADLAEKNRERILREVDYLKKQVHHALREKHEATLRKFDRVRWSVRPQGKPQERVYNLFSYVNQYGWDWLHSLIKEPLDLSHTHYAVDL